RGSRAEVHRRAVRGQGFERVLTGRTRIEVADQFFLFGRADPVGQELAELRGVGALGGARRGMVHGWPSSLIPLQAVEPVPSAETAPGSWPRTPPRATWKAVGQLRGAPRPGRRFARTLARCDPGTRRGRASWPTRTRCGRTPGPTGRRGPSR